MWIKINDKLYNTDDFSEIWQEKIFYEDRDFAPEVCLYARRKSGGSPILLSREPVLQELIHALDAKEVI